jgi:hypothetical protein
MSTAEGKRGRFRIGGKRVDSRMQESRFQSLLPDRPGAEKQNSGVPGEDPGSEKRLLKDCWNFTKTPDSTFGQNWSGLTYSSRPRSGARGEFQGSEGNDGKNFDLLKIGTRVGVILLPGRIEFLDSSIDL